MTREEKMQAVVEAARAWAKSGRPIPPMLDYALAALAALDAHTEADAETVTLGLIRARLSGQWAATERPEQEDPRDWLHVANITFVAPPMPTVPTIPATVTREGGR